MQLTQQRDHRTLTAVSQADERIATAARDLGLLAEALRALDEDESMLGEMLAAAPLDPLMHRRLAVLHQFRSTVYYDDRYPNLADPARSLISAKRYLEVAQEMAKSDPHNASAKFSQAVATYRVSFVLREFDPNAAIGLASDSVRMFDELIASGHASYLNESRHIQALQRLGEAQLKADRLTEASRSAEEALAGQRTIIAKNPAISDERNKLVPLLILAGKIGAASGNDKLAESRLREARDEAQRIAKGGELTSLIPSAHSEEALGDFYAQRGRVDEARACYQSLAELWRGFPEGNEYVGRQKASTKSLLASASTTH